MCSLDIRKCLCKNEPTDRQHRFNNAVTQVNGIQPLIMLLLITAWALPLTPQHAKASLKK